jgi:hypothetical protein
MGKTLKLDGSQSQLNGSVGDPSQNLKKIRNNDNNNDMKFSSI